MSSNATKQREQIQLLLLHFLSDGILQIKDINVFLAWPTKDSPLFEGVWRTRVVNGLKKMMRPTTLVGHGYSPTLAMPPQQWNNNDTSQAPAPFRQYAWATAFCFLTAALWFIWCISLINSVFTDGFPQLGTSPSYGNVFPYGYLTDRYGWDWWCVAILSWNIMLPMLLMYALANNKDETWRHLHEFLAKMGILFNVLIFLTLTWRWAFYCNTSYSGMQSACNDYRWCCAGWPSPWCPNNSPCTPTSYSFSDLTRNYEMTQHWIFSLVFFITACWHYNQNGMLVTQGVLQ
jgi:hypothetical protein